MRWSFSWLLSWEAIRDPGHLAQWRAAAEDPGAHATPFMHPGPVQAWLETAGGPEAWAPFFLHATSGDGQTVLWLLVRPRTGRGPAGAPACCGGLFDYHDPLAVPARATGDVLDPGFWPALEQELERRAGAWFDVCALSRLRPAVRGEAAFPGPGGRAPLLWLDAYPDFDTWLASRRRTIAGLGRAWERQAKAGLGFEAHAPGNTGAVLAWLPALEAARAARYPGSALPPGYLAALVRHGQASGLVRGSTLGLAGRTISWDLSFRLNGVFYGYMRAFDPAFSRLSPGRLHGLKVVEWLYAEGVHTFDFLLGAEEYKADWTDGEEVVLASRAIRSRAPGSRARQVARRSLGLLGRARAAVAPP